MRRTREIEDLVRRHQWPSPSAELRGRVMADAPDAPIAGTPRLHKVPAATELVPQPRQWRPHFGVLLVLSLIFTIGGCTGADIWAGRGVEAEVARLEARYGSLDQAMLRVPPVPDDDNRARVGRSAALLSVRPTKAEQRSLWGSGGPAPVLAGLHGFVEANSAAVRLAADIRSRGESNWDVDYEHAGPTDGLPGLEIDTLSDAIWVTALLDLEDGRTDDAATKISSGLALAASLRQEPVSFAQYLRVQIIHKQVQAVQRLITSVDPSRPALDEVARWLTESRALDQVRSGLLGELRQAHAIFTRMENGNVDPRIAHYVYPETWPALPDSWYGPIARMARPMVRLAHAGYLRQMGDMLAVETGPRPSPARPEPVPPRRWELVDRLVDKFASSLDWMIDRADGSNSELGAAEVAVALRRYRLDHGVYPDDLSALAPRYLPALPTDPYTGRPPDYSRQGAGFMLRAHGGTPTAAWWVFDWHVPR